MNVQFGTSPFKPHRNTSPCAGQLVVHGEIQTYDINKQEKRTECWLEKVLENGHLKDRKKDDKTMLKRMGQK
jgi:hypothetical protein